MNNGEEEETVCIKCGDIERNKSVNHSLDTLIFYAEKLNFIFYFN